ncbi:MAG: hypothetical protein JST73_04755 [Actinobacteria bacterium]|nr:hypothetical protein [Actinomycetota bacterium]
MATVRHSRIVAGLALVVVATVAAACDPIPGSISGPVRHAVLTSTSGSTYNYSGNADQVFVQPDPASTDANVREVFWYPNATSTQDQQSCAVWNTIATSSPDGLFQPGVALRIASANAANTGVKAITVTENVYYGAVWLFNVHVWNSLDTGQPFTQIGQFDLTPIVGTLLNGGSMVAPPWHVCARAIGATFSFMVWTGSNPQPSWTDPQHVFTVNLPNGWTYVGYPGAYIGHLRAGETAAFASITTGSAP